MKKEYVKPLCECITFEVKEVMMSGTNVDGPGSFEEGVEDW